MFEFASDKYRTYFLSFHECERESEKKKLIEYFATFYKNETKNK